MQVVAVGMFTKGDLTGETKFVVFCLFENHLLPAIKAWPESRIRTHT
jgi:hypothetical protein